MALLVNVWHLRKVAEASAKPCDICYKPSASVLITPDRKAFLYICPGHLKDRGFCSPIIDEAEVAAKRKKEALDREIEIIKREYEEKKKKKQSKEAQKRDKNTEKDTEKDKNAVKSNEGDDEVEKEKNGKIEALTAKASTSSADESPRTFALQKIFYQKQLDRIRSAEIAKRNRERLKNPSLFPSVPSGDLE
ncbi:MAG: hypothetical protein LQ342_008004 [Letrouitia transgressa]|nr:MAG: hypothetical protein LQ342_008004 [Letrouitia transgressa]